MFLPPRVVSVAPYGRLGAPVQRAGLLSEHGFKRLDCRAEPVVADSHTFYRCGGTWYDPVTVSGQAAYVEVWAPPGVTEQTLPEDTITVTAAGMTYYVAEGVFYQETDNDTYTLVQPANGTRMDGMPGGLKGKVAVVSEGQTYYPYHGIFYREVEEDGRTFYEVADSPFAPPAATATVSSPPRP